MKTPILYVGLDSEYVQAPVTEHSSRRDDFKQAKNDIVCYTAYAIYGTARWEFIAMMPKGERMKFREIIAAILTEGKKQGAFKKWPTAMNLAIHWSLADLTALDDLKDFQHQFDSHRKGFVTFEDACKLEYYDSGRNKREIAINLYDTLLLAPEGKRALSAIGELLGIPKFEISTEELENTRLFSEQHPERFREYALRDAKIAVEYVVKLREVLGAIVDIVTVPKTLSSVAETFALSHWVGSGTDVLSLLGVVEDKSGKNSQWVSHPKRFHSESIATESFHGGFAVASHFGPSGFGEWKDWDLSSAYLSAMSALGVPQWNDLRRASSVEDFTPDVLGAALVEFSFPESTRFPCIPVRALDNLIFPLQGRGYATAPEIHLALRLGARMRIVDDLSYVIPMTFEKRPFRDLATVIKNKRAALESERKKDTLEDLIFKLIGNSIYGKLSQGLQKKRVFNTRYAEMRPIPPSDLSNAHLAGAITGMIRATLIEILNRIPPHRSVLSATTDGFLTNASDEELFDAANGWLGNVLRHAADADPGTEPPPILTLKHQVKEALVWATRGQATLEYGDNPDKPSANVILAKGGIRCPLPNVMEQNEHLIRRFLERNFGDKTEITQFRGVREIYESRGDLDLGLKEVWIRYRMDFDWKRTPSTSGTRPILEGEHLWFDTLPLVSEQHFRVLREGWDRFRKQGERTLKTERDLEDFLSYLSIVPSRNNPVPADPDPVRTVIKRLFLRAYRRRMWGLDGTMSNRPLAAALSEIGIETSAHDVENAGRERTKEPVACLYRTPYVLRWLERIKETFPTFEIDALIVAEAPWSYSSTLHASLLENSNPDHG
ncbi:hypothetical protein [Luteolibacter sp. LG18]|uniref:hypothetical protein n=1 Tax=Luteolibacter sp. LG18 TaxID=2819286 RepID=UPI0030C74939